MAFISRGCVLLVVFFGIGAMLYAGGEQELGMPQYRFDYLDSIEPTPGLDAESADLILTRAGDPQSALYLDLDTVREFRQVTFTDFDPWLDEVRTYTGVYLWELLRYYGIEDEAPPTKIRIVAVNDFVGLIKLEDIKRYHYVLSYQENGVLYGDMEDPAEDKGPFAIAINFGAFDEMDKAVYKNHLVWWIEYIHVE
jgi:hypothetical protein